MLKKILFTKMHGLGNDFVIINSKDLPKNIDIQSLARQMADRRTGIGFDQFILYTAQEPESGRDYPKYEVLIFNYDGSRANQCGNALRCLVKLIYINSKQKDIKIGIGSRLMDAHILEDDRAMVNVGQVSFDKPWMPLQEDLLPVAERYMLDPKEIICADVGNPHIVIFSKLSTADKITVATTLQGSNLFRDGINVNFAELEDDKIYLSVWERGTNGFTKACGSGACASFASALKLGFIDSPTEIVFELGSLELSKKNDDIIMTGPASLVAIGEFYYV